MRGMKGGLSKSIAKSEGQKLNAIKKRISKEIANKEDAEWILQKLEDRPSMAADLVLYLHKLKQEGAIHPMQRVALLNTEANILKAVHGEKIKTENVNVNVNTTTEEWERRLSNLLTPEEREE